MTAESVPRVRMPARACAVCPTVEVMAAAVVAQCALACGSDPALVCRVFARHHWADVAALRSAERLGLVETVDVPADPQWLSRAYTT